VESEGCDFRARKWGLTVATTQTGGDDRDLGIVVLWGPEGTLLETKVLGSVQDNSVLCGEGNRRHGGGGNEVERIRTRTSLL
jgi:hypothetical protein